MRRRAELAIAIVAVTSWTAGACSPGSFACEDDAQCRSAGVAGVCEPSGGCSFVDPACDSGKRYGEHAPGGLGGTCVPVDGGTDAGSTTTGGPTSLDATSLESTIGTEVGTLTAGSSGMVSAESGTGASTETGDPPAMFFDPFDREDGTAIGNGWIEKTPNAFGLGTEQVRQESPSSNDYRDNLCYRPVDESFLDVEVTMVASFFDEAFGFPQVHLRVQPDTVQTAAWLDSYVVYLALDPMDPFNPQLAIHRVLGGDMGASTASGIVFPDPGSTIRLRARVTGTDPVVVEGWLESGGPEGRWMTVTMATLVDETATRLASPGTVGFSGHLDLGYLQYDDFGYTELVP